MNFKKIHYIDIRDEKDHSVASISRKSSRYNLKLSDSIQKLLLRSGPSYPISSGRAHVEFLIVFSI